MTARRGDAFARRVLWPAVIILSLIALAASVGRTVSVYQTRGLAEVPDLSPADREATRGLARMLGMHPDSEDFREIDAQNRAMLGKFYRYRGATLLHVLPAAFFALLAPLQFSRRIRARAPRWHRWSGRVLVTMVVPIGLSGLFFGLFMPFSGPPEAAAIAVFGALFLFAAVRAVVAIRRRQVALHREWMLRMFAVGIGIAVVRLVGSALALITRQGPAEWFALSIWIGFGLSVGAAEMWIRHTRPRGGGDAPPPVRAQDVSSIGAGAATSVVASRR